MPKKPIIFIVVLLALTVAALLWWQPVPEAERPKTSGLPMKVSRYYWPGEYWVEIADKKGWFREAGLNVELVDTNPDYYASVLDLAKGKMDTNDLTLFDLVKFNAEDVNLVMVINSDSSFGSEAIVGKREIESIRDLKGKTVGVAKDSYLEYILDVVLERNGLTPQDIKTVDIAAEKAAEALIQGSVDAIVTWEPIVTEVIEKGNGRKLFDTSEISGISPNGYVFHKSFIEERPEDVQAFVEVWHRATNFIRENPGEAFGIIADIYDVTPGEAQAFSGLNRIMDLRDNRIAFTYAAGFESLHGTAQQINDFMIDRGLTGQQLDCTEFIDDRFIRNLRR